MQYSLACPQTNSLHGWATKVGSSMWALLDASGLGVEGPLGGVLMLSYAAGTLAPRCPLHEFLSAINPAYVGSAAIQSILQVWKANNQSTFVCWCTAAAYCRSLSCG